MIQTPFDVHIHWSKRTVLVLQGMVEFCCFSYDVLSQHTYCDFIEAAVCFGFLFMCTTVNFFIFSVLKPYGHKQQAVTPPQYVTSPCHKNLTVLYSNRNQKKLLHQENHEKCAV